MVNTSMITYYAAYYEYDIVSILVTGDQERILSKEWLTLH